MVLFYRKNIITFVQFIILFFTMPNLSTMICGTIFKATKKCTIKSDDIYSKIRCLKSSTYLDTYVPIPNSPVYSEQN